jgi:hypothetical protein
LVKVWWFPLVVRSASQYVPIVVPPARSNSTRHDVVVVEVSLVTVNRPWYPVPQSPSLANVAVAACAGPAVTATDTRATPASSTEARADRNLVTSKTVSKVS